MSMQQRWVTWGSNHQLIPRRSSLSLQRSSRTFVSRLGLGWEAAEVSYEVRSPDGWIFRERTVLLVS